MAGETISMIKLKQIFLLRNNGSSYESISKIVQSSRNTVKKYLRLAEQRGYSLQDLAGQGDQELEKLFSQPVQFSKNRYLDLEQLFPWMQKELKRTGVNRWFLWGEYKSQHPDGYSYSQFCDHYSRWTESSSASMHLEHLPGEKLFIDFSGKKLQIVDRKTGEIQKVEVYVALLGHSQLTYVEALADQKKESFIKATENALHYFQGVPMALVPDNLKSAVNKAVKYEPLLNKDFLDFANHYGISVYPARSKKPKDKALVEKAVSIVYTRIFAPLRDRVFFSLEELNFAIKELLEKYNKDYLFQKEAISRRDKFEKNERQSLKPLPGKLYELKYYKTAKVMKNCHIQLEKHYYSVPFRYIGKQVKIIYTSSTVYIFYKSDRIALHVRSKMTFKYTTIKDHLPSTHQFVSEWSPDKFISWAERISPVVKKYIENILGQKIYPEQAYRSCIGILSYEKKLGKQRLINAIERAVFYNVYNYTAVKKILEGGLDSLTMDDNINNQQSIPFHENIRGKERYK